MYILGLNVDVVSDYADTSMTTQTLFENFEGFLQILKEQSGKKTIFGCVHTYNSNNLKISKPPYLKKIRIFNLCDRLSSLKRKSSQNRFCLFIWGLG